MNKLILLSALLLLCYESNAQTTQIIVYDKAASDFVKDKGIPDNVKEGSTVGLMYININPFAYTSAGSFSNINRDYTTGMSAMQDGLANISKAEATATEEKAKVDNIKGNKINLKKFMSETYNVEVKYNGQQTSVVKQSLNDQVTILGHIRTEFENIQVSILTINALMNMDTIIKMAKDNPANDDAAKMTSAILDPAGVPGVTTPANVMGVFTTAITNIGTARNNIAGYTGLLSALKEGLSGTPKAELEVLIDTLNKKVNVLNTTYFGPNGEVLQKNAVIIAANFRTAINTPFELPVRHIATASGDFLKMSDTLKDKTGNAFILGEHSIPTYGGFRVDFSIGLAASIGGNGADYSLRKNPDNVTGEADTSKVVLKEDGTNKLFQFSPVVFVHWYGTTKLPVQWMLSVGLAPDFSTLAKTKLYIGTSLGFPSTNDLTKRLVVSFGASLGYADVLKGKYKGWNDYKRFADIDDSDLTEKALRVGGFLAISYNLGGSGH